MFEVGVMPFGGVVKYANDPAGIMKEALISWTPSDPSDKRRKLPVSEKGWENSLLEHLRNEFPDFNFIPQAGAGMVRGDIVLERKAMLGLGGFLRDIIELKQGLSSTGQYQRLIGRIETYRMEKGWTFVVICGEPVDAKVMRALKDHYENFDRLAIFWKKGAGTGVETLTGGSGGLHPFGLGQLLDQLCKGRPLPARPSRFHFGPGPPGSDPVQERQAHAAPD